MKISHEDKVFYPDDGLTKGDVVGYYRDVADVMVPHLRGRPLTLRRFPDGIAKQGWFQKHPGEHFPDSVRVERVPRRGGGTDDYVVCDDAETLEYLANQGTVEFHVWLSTVDAPERPDRLVLDLDPPDRTPVAELRATARRIRDEYERAGLTAFVQATGGRGFHVLAPLDAKSDTEVVLDLSRALADRVAAADPDRLTTAQRKEKRGDRIFLDANRNGYAQTFVAPYSLRARPGAAAATPLDWRELGKADPDGWSLAKEKQRLARKDDPWRDLDGHAASAEAALAKLG
ncbi:bifunctional non-homologous end joining protein LigD [Amycolatopsis lexingtonensis]|uniref:Bifunctional non-homologous end joining protein LigD n=1 Tax=Amycolatopsis lexingtonensis TaxID=218822 RepID=A0ABR9HWC8_9PSEU|nr:non-homologous end-joining DNA ligase [Amycolatopsis lexingtonensis]MBE1495240.1 bifunctional non-homologous end joining protein LigD [Amycolatopsis lexingtonensis]